MIGLANRVQVGTMISVYQHEKLKNYCKTTGQKKSRVIETALSLYFNLDKKEILDPNGAEFEKLSTSFDERQYKSIQNFIKEKEAVLNKDIKMYLVLYSALENYFSQLNY